MPKGIVEENKKAQFDASIRREKERSNILLNLRSQIDSLQSELERRKQIVKEEYEQFLLEMEEKKDVLKREIRELKKEKEQLQ